MTPISGTNISGYAFLNGLCVAGVMIDALHAISTTAGKFAVGCKLTDLSTGASWVNVGTSSAPSWIQSDLIVLPISISSSQILALFDTPIVIIPAPPLSNQYIAVDEILLKINAGATAYTGSHDVKFFYGDDSSATVGALAADLPVAQLNSASSVVFRSLGKANISSLPAQTKVSAFCLTANPGDGDGTITGYARYHIVNI